MDLFSDQPDINCPIVISNPPSARVDWDQASCGHVVTVPGGDLYFKRNFFSRTESDNILAYFLENNDVNWAKTDWREYSGKDLDAINFKNISWHHDTINMYGKKLLLPRFSALYGSSDRPYTYSGIKLKPKLWSGLLLDIRNAVSDIAGVEFNTVLMNWYRDGDDHIGWHSDEEKELGINPTIASVTFGETRRFMLRMCSNAQEKLDIPLSNGSLLIMSGQLQHNWQHSIPKQKAANGMRINLTFRDVKM